ncbi:MAG: DsbE family thiol:disulfide interchange protein [Gammaproteobacteria bacterium]|jgi:cytochrome c biogenesis protein CcmG/thiol:disulfide interchange protein DsbE|nr:DsbE family thiol:disulfide interchange protein [Gammaproteobacteria bacterium]MDH3986560.1 DsbE family thiol:disulfide interchange protein [Gammaproteobacteria bacterium]
MSRYLRYLVPLAIFFILVAFLYRGLSLDPKRVPSPLVGKPMPEFSLPRLKDPAATLSDSDLKGKVSVLNIWATWCVSCRAEHEVLLQLANTGLVNIYGLNYKDERAKAQQWLQQLGDPYVANAFDADGRTGIDWGVYGAPETFIMDKLGMIRHKHIGPLTVEALNSTILPLIAELQATP